MAKSALFVWGGWSGHEPKLGVDLFAPFLESQGYEVEISDTLDAFLDVEKLKHLDLIVPVWTMGKISKEQLDPVVQAVDSGVGIAGWHGCMCDSFRESTEWQFMTGGQWVAHPGNIMDYTVQITDPTDPVMAGIKDFSMHSEQYYLHVDPGVQVLATTTFSGEHAAWTKGVVMPVAWKKMWGAGRVFYNALGHVRADFDVPEARTMMERGLLWASR